MQTEPNWSEVQNSTFGENK